MVDDELIDILTTPKMINKDELTRRIISQIARHAETLNNAIENDKVLVAGREAGSIQAKATFLLKILNK